MKYRFLNTSVAMLLFGLMCGKSQAVEAFGATPQEVSLCSALIFGGRDRAYMESLEPDAGWGHTHHWCDCVRFRYRAVRSIGDKSSFNYNTGQALQGCDYVIRAVPSGSRILPKVHVDKGLVLKLRGETRVAAQEFQRALSLDPSEAKAYSELSLLQEESGQRTAARDTVALGLQHNPESKLLRKRYLELGGKEPFPEPPARDVQVPVPPTAPPDSSGEPALPEPLDLDLQEPVIAVDAQSESAEAGSQSAENGKAVTDANARSCRFCPPEEIQRRWIESFKAGQEKKPE
ncbi:tetratricopeptide repeat protein [Aromatoleum evansii]|uniref:tetratricopeptide repeat protein n=1 Tax=Aromatoleum evansii TaxID=59406 RepID=UPI00145FA742|nr:hypothetical protein [Aromatoleum evansii]NMG28296.1 hypothetical protein [Aromatoleum evansii]